MNVPYITYAFALVTTQLPVIQTKSSLADAPRVREPEATMPSFTEDEWAGMDVSIRRGNDHDPSWFAGVENDPRVRDATDFDLVIVGAGISGCVFAERASRELGLKPLIVDNRDHIGGNCYDFINGKGIRVSQYGVHLFHTQHERV